MNKLKKYFAIVKCVWSATITFITGMYGVILFLFYPFSEKLVQCFILCVVLTLIAIIDTQTLAYKELVLFIKEQSHLKIVEKEK